MCWATHARALAAGFNVVRMNMRSCGGTDELCANHLPFRPLGRRGRSLRPTLLRTSTLNPLHSSAIRWAANLVLKYAGEVARHRPASTQGRVGISPLMDLAVSSAALHEPQNRVYEWHFLRSMLGASSSQRPLYFRKSTQPQYSTRFAVCGCSTNTSWRGMADLRMPTITISASQVRSTRRAFGSPLSSFIRSTIRLSGCFLLLVLRSSKTRRSHYVETRARRPLRISRPGTADDDGRWAEMTLLWLLA